jgi:23S rRNA (guanine1835-N2)-methyltransferase
VSETKAWASPLGDLALSRWPVRPDDPLQAWDGADTYLIEALNERGIEGPVLVVGDAFGALSVALAGHGAGGWGDSEVARLALQVNAARAGVEVPWAPITQPPPLSAPAAAVVRIPKSLRRLGWVLSLLADVLPAGTPVLLGGKSKTVQKSHVAAAEAALGPAHSTLARHRARLVVATRDDRVGPRWPVASWELEPGLTVKALPGVFGEDRLDGGTRLLTRQIGPWDAARIVDLGCGAGPLGLLAGARNPQAEVVFRDVSHAAVRSAELGWRESRGDAAARFEVGDALAGVEDGSVDVVLCNPPFHQGTEITRRVAAHMFAEGSRVLRPGGRMLVVGNRHLAYHLGMGRTLVEVRPVDGDARFVVLEGIRAG